MTLLDEISFVVNILKFHSKADHLKFCFEHEVLVEEQKCPKCKILEVKIDPSTHRFRCRKEYEEGRGKRDKHKEQCSFQGSVNCGTFFHSVCCRLFNAAHAKSIRVFEKLSLLYH